MKSRRASIVVGLAFGDCGKGAIVDYLARNGDAHTVVRFNGGPQAGHNVVTADGRHHTFSQFGSGTLAGPRVATLLSRFMLIEPYALLNEAAHLQQIGCENVWERLLIDERCIVITPAHQAANRLRELSRGAGKHGTCGLGVGEATADAIERPDLILRAGDLGNRDLVARKIRLIVEYKSRQLRSEISLNRDSPDAETLLNPRWIDVAVDACFEVARAARVVSPVESDAILNQPGEIVFEGAQGALLDQDFGFHPHTTWSSTTTANAKQLLREAGIDQNPRRIGVLRSYFTRHGAGPFVSEDPSLRDLLNEPHNNDDGAQGRFRVGVFDAVAARYAISFAGVDELAITHLDRLPILPNYFSAGYENSGPFEIRPVDPSNFQQREELSRAIQQCRPVFRDLIPNGFLEQLQKELQLPITLISSGPGAVKAHVPS